jgi:hypothetical protein
MNFFDTLIHPDREENAQRGEVARAANLLQVGEFQLLQLAYEAWFGQEMPPRECDRLFGDYMMRDQVPHWARHYARRIIGLDADGALDDRDAAYHRYDPQFRAVDPGGVRKFCAAAALILVFLGGGLWFSHLPLDRKTSQMFPPYVSDRDIGVTKRGFGP